MTPTLDYLRALNACGPAVAWIGDRDLATAWRECPRGDWMLWLVGWTVAADPASDARRRLVWVACQCARLSLPIWEARYPDDPSPRRAIETAERWTRDEATIAEVSAAAYAAAAYAAAAYAAAAYAAAASAADAAAYAADAADAARATLAECADLCRAEWPECPVSVPRAGEEVTHVQ